METTRTTRKRTKARPLRVLLLTVVLASLVLALFAGTALAAPPWSDAPNSWWVNSYGVTDTQVGTVADGYPNGTFKPALAVTRGQFAKMAVDGLGVSTANPATPTFSDVAPGDTYYAWIEGGYDAGIIGGYGDGTFRPDTSSSRQQTNSILGLYLSQKELGLRGHVAGDVGNYASLNAWYLAEGIGILGGFADAASVASVHAPATAYLAYHDVVKGIARGGALYLDPGTSLVRSQAAVLILRVRAVTFPTAVPTVTALSPTGQATTAAGTAVTITGTNFVTGATVAFGGTAATSVVVVNATTITCLSPAHALGVVDVTVTTAAGTSSTAGAGNDYTYGLLPTVTALSPTGQATTAAGTHVTITGTNFVTGATVAFGGTAATSVVVVSSTSITCVSPAHAVGVVEVTVTTPAGTSSTAGTGNDYTYGLPTVTALNPTGQPTTAAGTHVTITGTNFVAGATVAFGTGYAATSVVVVSSTTITCVSPAHAVGVVDVTVTTPAGTSSTAGAGNDYTYGLVTQFAVTMSGGTTALSAVAKTAGTSFSVRVTAQDVYGNTVTGYTGTVALTSTAFAGTVYAVITSGGLVDGIVITPTIAGIGRTITATAGTITTSDASGPFTVNTTAFAKLQILLPGETAAPGTASGKTGTPTAQIAGTAFNVIVNAVDASWNKITSVVDNVGITSTDVNAILPANALLVTGTQTFSVTLKTVGSWTVTATDLTDGTKTANTSPLVTVTVGAFTKLQILLPGETAAPGTASGKTGTPMTQAAGVAFTATVNAVDANWNKVSSTHTVRITSSDGGATLPSDAPLVAGTKTFSVTLTVGSWTVTATDLTDGTKTANTSPAVTVTVSGFAKLQILLPGETAAPGTASGKTGTPTAQIAGTAFNVIVNAVDASWNKITSVVDNVGITSTDVNAVLPANALLVTGTQTFSVTLKTVGSWTVTATDLTDGTKTANTSPLVTVTVGAFTKLQILLPGETAAPGTASGKTGTPATQLAGIAFTATVNAVDASWNKVSSTDNIHITSSDPAAALPSDAPLVAGTKTFSVTLAAGSWTVTATDLTDGTKTANTSTSVTVTGDSTKLQILLPGETAAPFTGSGKTGTPTAQTAGTAFTVTVNAVDANWNVVSLADTVGITSTDVNAVLPANALLVAGTKTFSVTLKTVGSWTLTATDIFDSVDIPSDTSPLVTVNVGTFTKLQILLPGETAAPGTATGKTGTPTARTAGTAFNVTVNAVDANWNVVSSTDTVGITSTDINATPPSSAALAAGTQTFSVTLKTAGSWTITATDATDGTKTANTSPAVTVNAGVFTKLQILLPGETAAPGTASGKTGTPTARAAGIAFNVIVNAVDANWNLVSSIHTVGITSSDGGATLPSSAALVGGTGTFSVTLTAGSWTVTATDLTDGTKTADTSPAVLVNP